MTSTLTEPERRLTLLDVCDRCGAAALTVYTINGVELMFCGHHAKKHHDDLRRQGADLIHEEMARYDT